eukprot:SAG22_NODE_2272_length_2766_cov_4.135358_3_plen_128_part_00
MPMPSRHCLCSSHCLCWLLPGPLADDFTPGPLSLSLSLLTPVQLRGGGTGGGGGFGGIERLSSNEIAELLALLDAPPAELHLRFGSDAEVLRAAAGLPQSAAADDGARHGARTAGCALLPPCRFSPP